MRVVNITVIYVRILLIVKALRFVVLNKFTIVNHLEKIREVLKKAQTPCLIKLFMPQDCSSFENAG